MTAGVGKRLSLEERQTAVRLFKEGKKLVTIGNILGVSYVAVRETVKKEGVYVKPDPSACHRIHAVDETVFNDVNEKSSYWIGFLMADGYILDSKKSNVYRLGLTLHEKDKDHLLRFRSFLKSSHPIKEKVMKNHPRDEKSCSLSINSNVLCNALIKHGVTPRKSLTALADPSMESNRDFWRGVVDGDGSVEMEGKAMPCFSCVGSHNLMTQFFNYLKNNIPYTPVLEFGKRSKVATVRASGEGAKQICDLLYKDCKVSLHRKNKNYKLMMKTKKYRVFSAEGRSNMSKAGLKSWSDRKQKEIK